MNEFIIRANQYLRNDIQGYYHGKHYNYNRTEVGFINTLKNDYDKATAHIKQFGYTLTEAENLLYNVLKEDLPKILENKFFDKKPTVCVIPRAKRDLCYRETQLRFMYTIKRYITENLDKFEDGTEYIKRIVDTETTHLTRNYASVYPGITRETCEISEMVIGKNILLIDDIYTPNVNIVEDAIQALLDRGANQVVFYAVGKTEQNLYFDIIDFEVLL
ncbi:MAG: hypothetical protein N2043_09140 [Ignavibacterium sp.]|nr:hypothetical protein [Ignavibacterium sp.]